MSRLAAVLVSCWMAWSFNSFVEAQEATPSVFDMPRIQTQHAKLRVLGELLGRQQRFADAEKAFAQMIKLVPHDPLAHYNIACMQARQGKTAEALEMLLKAAELGFDRPEILKQDPDLSAVRELPKFNDVVDAATIAVKPPSPWQHKVQPANVDKGQAVITEQNVGWDSKHGLLVASIAPQNEAELRRREVITGHGKIGELIRGWYSRGEAAGNIGDFYDNHDNDHSNMVYQQYPQLTRIEFGADVKKRNMHSGLQTHFFYPGVVIGNSSTAMVNTPFWRSQPRLAYTNRRATAVLHAQYRKNHLYFYPEHNDHDPRYGDVYPINTPYVIISQGSSGSDRPFMDAVAATLAALRPEVKEKLKETGMLMPTVQFVFRASNKNVAYPREYLSGKAHPSVFEKNNLDALKMVQVAHGLTLDKLPPLAVLKVVEEDEPTVGIDYFDIAPRQKLCDTPCVIGRVHRMKKYYYRMVVSAEQSYDVNGKPLTYHWKVLRGNEFAIKIKPLKEDNSVVELLVPYHKMRPISPEDKLESSRVEIGCFAHNGTLYSPPSFICFHTLADETRVYNDQHQVVSAAYNDPWGGGKYADPLLHTAKVWTDTYHYDAARRVTGWTRRHGEKTDQFTANGKLITRKDHIGRAKEARTVRYRPQARGKNPPLLTYQPTNEVFVYGYDSDEDLVGTIISRTVEQPE